jgi:cbb3-type cytochrome oxidase maturation protein
MDIIIVLIFFSLLVALGFLAAFIWAVKTGQFDDKYTPSIRILMDEKKESNNNEMENHQKKGS